MKRSGLWVMVACLVAMTGWANEAPPANLHLVGDHWTAWDPPSSLPEGVPTHVIQTGDTLWSLAGKFYGDPYLWPQLWEQNRYILDAHWIYPGDPLVVPGAAVPRGAPGDGTGIAAPPIDSTAAQTLPEEPAAEDPFASRESLSGVASDSAGDVPVALGHESDIYCSGYIGEVDEAFPYQVMSSEFDFLTPSLDPRRGSDLTGLWGKAATEKYGLGLGDIVYLNGGRAGGLSAGEVLTAVVPRGKIIHPLTQEELGRFYGYLGRVRVLSVQESSAIGEISQSCNPIPVGTQLKPFEPEPVPLRRRTSLRPVNYPAQAEELEGSAAIILTHDQVVLLGRGSLVYVDRGFEDDVAPGDTYTIYRKGRRGFPPVVLGELGVLSVQRKTALARILESRYSIFVGDSLLPK
ncbi:MAG: LysM peptidoglycan-binding domain-containing protein [Thermoanaerobaculia bacterium]|nr:LysM peptidoglycan-binding domain-containing protein [Thermoanaerobaculia bacterium]